MHARFAELSRCQQKVEPLCDLAIEKLNISLIKAPHNPHNSKKKSRPLKKAPKMIPLLRAIVPASPATCHAVVRMAPRAVAASIGSGGNALASSFFRGEVRCVCMFVFALW